MGGSYLDWMKWTRHYLRCALINYSPSDSFCNPSLRFLFNLSAFWSQYALSSHYFIMPSVHTYITPFRTSKPYIPNTTLRSVCFQDSILIPLSVRLPSMHLWRSIRINHYCFMNLSILPFHLEPHLELNDTIHGSYTPFNSPLSLTGMEHGYTMRCFPTCCRWWGTSCRWSMCYGWGTRYRWGLLTDGCCFQMRFHKTIWDNEVS